MEVQIWTKPELRDWWGIYPAECDPEVVRMKAIGWIRRKTNVPGKPYMVKIYGAEFDSQGMLPGAKTDCRVFSTINKAKLFVANHFGEAHDLRIH